MSTRKQKENDSKPFSAYELEKVWESFYRADNARTGEGTGLGLAIVKSVVELHGGKCFVRNTKAGVEFGFGVRGVKATIVKTQNENQL